MQDKIQELEAEARQVLTLIWACIFNSKDEWSL